MKHYRTLPAHAAARAATPLLLLVLLIATSAGQQQQQESSAAPAVGYTYQGTIHSVQPARGTLTIVTGVGHALRLVSMQAVAATRITGAGAAMPLSQLRPGDIVRAQCHPVEGRMVADAIQKLSPEGAP